VVSGTGDIVDNLPPEALAVGDLNGDGANDVAYSSYNLGVTVLRQAGSDTSAPDTTITSGPANPTTSTSATFTFGASEPGTRAICRAMMLEAKAIGDYLGLHLRVDIERRIDGAGALGPHKMSMLQDLERGRSMEVEPLVGVVQELGLYTGIPTPTTDVVLALIRQRAQYATGSLH